MCFHFFDLKYARRDLYFRQCHNQNLHNSGYIKNGARALRSDPMLDIIILEGLVEAPVRRQKRLRKIQIPAAALGWPDYNQSHGNRTCGPICQQGSCRNAFGILSVLMV